MVTEPNLSEKQKLGKAKRVRLVETLSLIKLRMCLVIDCAANVSAHQQQCYTKLSSTSVSFFSFFLSASTSKLETQIESA